jgi:hypothetical protein
MVGMPGAGISGLFYLFAVLLMPVRACWLALRGQPLGASGWRVIVRHWSIVIAIVAALWLTAVGLGLIAGQVPGNAGGATSAGGEPRSEPLSGLVVRPETWLLGLAALAALLLLVEILSAVERRARPKGSSLPEASS